MDLDGPDRRRCRSARRRRCQAIGSERDLFGLPCFFAMLDARAHHLPWQRSRMPKQIALRAPYDLYRTRAQLRSSHLLQLVTSSLSWTSFDLQASANAVRRSLAPAGTSSRASSRPTRTRAPACQPRRFKRPAKTRCMRIRDGTCHLEQPAT